MQSIAKIIVTFTIITSLLTLSSCTNSSSSANMGGSDITPAARKLAIQTESTGDFFYGRRYYVQKTRFWGYVRKPRQPWSRAQLVVMNEDNVRQPDRLPEAGPVGARHGYDQNYQYKITGYYTGRKIYEPASNLFLPEFKATSYSLIEDRPGWLFTPQDRYNPKLITLVNENVSPARN